MARSPSSALFWQRHVAALTVFFGLASGSCFGHPAYLTVPATPYDRQMVRVHPLLATANKGPGAISLFSVNRWMTELRAMPYQYFGHWQTPAEVNSAQAADCKGKAVALYAQMRRNGAQNLRIVIGKHHIYNSVTHAWLEWDRPEGSFMLDPTFNEMPIKTAELDPMSYLPFYAYDGARKYRVANAGFLAPTTRVATGNSNYPNLPAVTGTTFARPGLNGVRSRPFPPSTTQYLNKPRPTLNAQPSWSNERRLSSSKMRGLGRDGAPLVNPATQYLVSAHPIAAAPQKRMTLNVRHSTSRAMKRAHARSIAHRGHRVIRTRSRLASSL